jgi:acyl-CoA thioesterase
MRLVEDRPLDELAATMLADAGPPALFAHLTEAVAMPSVEIDLHFAESAGLADGPWLLGCFRTIHASEGYAIEDGELWTPAGHLVLTVRQQRRLLGADSTPRSAALA